MLNINSLHPRVKAMIITAIFILAGIMGGFFADTQLGDIYLLPPLLIFYAVLTLNTYISIVLFSGITPMHDGPQRFIDFILFALYLTLAFALQNPIMFFVILLFIFIVAPIKYMLLLGRIPHPRLLKKKVLIDLLGTLMSACVLAIALLGYVSTAAWLLAGLFSLANVLLLIVNPMYRLIDK
jgi:hypothetical protein